MKSKKIKIAVIDDGINKKVYNTGILKYDIEITPKLIIKERYKNNPYFSSHGTVCAAIIKKYSKNADLSSIKILNNEIKGIKFQLIKAIEWCINNNIKLINLSLGSIDYRDFIPIKNIINYAYKKGIIIVAACHNENIITYPASLSTVIGVKANTKKKLKEGEFIFNLLPLDGIEITAYATHSIVNYKNEKIKLLSSNSYAVPLITGIINIFLQENPDLNFNEIKKKLALNAKNRIEKNYLVNYHNKIDWIENALIFNFYTNTFILNNIKYNFNVNKIYNIKCRSILEGIKKTKKKITFQDINFTKVDTIILNIIDQKIEQNFKITDFFKYIDKFKKNIVFIDDNFKDIDVYRFKLTSNIKIYHPYLNKEFYKYFKKKRKYEMPLLVIYDFIGINFYNDLSNCFKNDGYYPVTCTNICQSILTNSEYIPTKNSSYDKIVIHQLKTLPKIYYADILIYYIDMINTKFFNYNYLNKKLNIDIKIIITNEYNKHINQIIQKNSYSKVILVSPLDKNDINIQKKNQKVHFLKTISELYGKILFLFNK